MRSLASAVEFNVFTATVRLYCISHCPNHFDSRTRKPNTNNFRYYGTLAHITNATNNSDNYNLHRGSIKFSWAKVATRMRLFALADQWPSVAAEARSWRLTPTDIIKSVFPLEEQLETISVDEILAVRMAFVLSLRALLFSPTVSPHLATNESLAHLHSVLSDFLKVNSKELQSEENMPFAQFLSSTTTPHIQLELLISPFIKRNHTKAENMNDSNHLLAVLAEHTVQLSLSQFAGISPQTLLDCINTANILHILPTPNSSNLQKHFLLSRSTHLALLKRIHAHISYLPNSDSLSSYFISVFVSFITLAPYSQNIKSISSNDIKYFIDSTTPNSVYVTNMLIQLMIKTTKSAKHTQQYSPQITTDSIKKLFEMSIAANSFESLTSAVKLCKTLLVIANDNSSNNNCNKNHVYNSRIPFPEARALICALASSSLVQAGHASKLINPLAANSCIGGAIGWSWNSTNGEDSLATATEIKGIEKQKYIVEAFYDAYITLGERILRDLHDARTSDKGEEMKQQFCDGFYRAAVWVVENGIVHKMKAIQAKNAPRFDVASSRGGVALQEDDGRRKKKTIAMLAVIEGLRIRAMCQTGWNCCSVDSGSSSSEVSGTDKILRVVKIGVMRGMFFQPNVWKAVEISTGVSKTIILKDCLTEVKNNRQENVEVLIVNQILSLKEKEISCKDEHLLLRQNWDIATFTIFIRKALEANNLTQAEKLYQEMANRRMKVTPNVLHLFLHHFAREKESGAGKRKWVLAEMEKHNIPINSITLTILLRGIAEDGDWKRVEILYREYIEVVQEVNQLDEIFFNSILGIAANQGRTDIFDIWFGRMSEIMTPGLISLYQALRAVCWNHRGQYPDVQYLEKRAWKLLKQISTVSAEEKNSDLFPVTYCLVMRAYAKLSIPEKCDEVLQEFNKNLSFSNSVGIASPILATRIQSHQETVHNAYLSCLLVCNEWLRAKQHFKTNRDMFKSGSLVAYTSALNLLIRGVPYISKNTAESKNLQISQQFDEIMIQAFAILKNCSKDSDLIKMNAKSVNSIEKLKASLLISKIRNGEKEKAKEYWYRWLKKNMQHGLVVDVIKSCWNPVDRYSSVKKNPIVWTCLINVLADSGWKIAELKEMAREMQEFCAADAKQLEALYVVLVARVAKQGNFKDTENLIEEYGLLSGRKLNEKFLSARMTAYNRSGNFKKVDAIWSEITTQVSKGLASEACVCTYLDSFGFRDDFLGLEQAWQLLISWAKSNKQSGKRFMITENHCNSYIEALIRLGKINEALTFAKQLWNEAERNHRLESLEIYPTQKMYNTIIRGLINIKMEREMKEFKKWCKVYWPKHLTPIH
ncbi:hypothetical protein HK100_003550 [Physocladia obscura]|uniref:Pentatricopeptide repeat-containing protein n=1 Tax=Physocladia obscura TaxID=109957 RepID=A0AAD5XKS4_9FUNG|nr:hypothetical protein HK100_003550 [Physocladia obscura]